jgi:two-component system sensor histidine kinase NblS
VGIGTTFWFDVAAYRPDAIEVLAKDATHHEVEGKDLAIAAISPSSSDTSPLAPKADQN